MADAEAPTDPLGSAWIGMNLLMVSPDVAIVDGSQPDLIATLEARGVQVIPLRLRHARRLGGGFHCVTLDTVRDGALEDYFERAGTDRSG
jgi:glycine amidinotransferase